MTVQEAGVVLGLMRRGRRLALREVKEEEVSRGVSGLCFWMGTRGRVHLLLEMGKKKVENDDLDGEIGLIHEMEAFIGVSGYASSEL